MRFSEANFSNRYLPKHLEQQDGKRNWAITTLSSFKNVTVQNRLCLTKLSKREFWWYSGFQKRWEENTIPLCVCFLEGDSGSQLQTCFSPGLNCSGWWSCQWGAHGVQRVARRKNTHHQTAPCGKVHVHLGGTHEVLPCEEIKASHLKFYCIVKLNYLCQSGFKIKALSDIIYIISAIKCVINYTSDKKFILEHLWKKCLLLVTKAPIRSSFDPFF